MDDENKLSTQKSNKLKEEQKIDDKIKYNYYNHLDNNNNNNTMNISNYIYSKDIKLKKEEKRNYNNNGLIKILRNKKSIKYILIINVINLISSKINYHENILLNSSEIILKINKTGMNNILFNVWLNDEYPCPSSIYLNDTIQSLTDCTKINIDTPGSIVKLVWNNPLNSTILLLF